MLLLYYGKSVGTPSFAGEGRRRGGRGGGGVGEEEGGWERRREGGEGGGRVGERKNEDVASSAAP